MNHGEHPEAGLSGNSCKDIPYETDPVVVVGFVSDGPDAWGDLPDGYAVRSFELLPWKRADGEVVTDPLLVLEKVEYNGTLDENGDDEDWWGTFFETCPKGVVRRLTVKISQDQERSVLVASHEPSAADEETLTNSAKETAIPDEFESPHFGTLRFIPKHREYCGTVNWDGSEVKLSLEFDKNRNAEAAHETASQLWQKQKQVKQDAEEFAAQQLLQLKNERWLHEDESEIDTDEFKSRLELEAIDVGPDGSFRFWFKDGDLFWGHLIEVSGGKSGWDSADIQG